MGQGGEGGAEVARDVVKFRGHAMVRSSHPTTLELTTEDDLTENGDCIIGVGASKGCLGLDARVKSGLKREGSEVTLRLTVGGESFEVHAKGDPRLQLSHPHEMVVRKSDFANERTLALKADASARDLPRRMVALLRDPSRRGVLEIEVR